MVLFRGRYVITVLSVLGGCRWFRRGNRQLLRWQPAVLAGRQVFRSATRGRRPNAAYGRNQMEGRAPSRPNMLYCWRPRRSVALHINWKHPRKRRTSFAIRY